MSPPRAKAGQSALRHRLDHAALALLVLSCVLSISAPSACAATWSSTDATTTEAITNAPPQRDPPAERPAQRRRASGSKHEKAPKSGKSGESVSSQDSVVGTESVVTSTLPGPGRSANTVTVGTPQIVLHSTGGTTGGMPGAAPCVPVHFAMGSPPQGQSAEVDSWYCPEGQAGHPLTPR